MAKQQLNRALSMASLKAKKYKSFEFENEWFEAFDKPERRGVWFVWGNSGNGKSRFVAHLCKELSRFGRIVYNSLEEADSKTIRTAFEESGLLDLNRKIILVHESAADLSLRLQQHKSPDIAIIDSYQYTRLTYSQYIDFKEKHRNKLLIFISHADGKQPSGRSAKSVMYDAALKIWVEGYVAFSKGRYIGPNGGKYIVWRQGAKKYFGDDFEDNINNYKQ